MKVICISGKARHGKDTAAARIEDELRYKGYKVLVAHYADLLKYICRTFFGWNGKKDEEGRRILQYVGTDVIRKQIPNYWVDFIISILTLFKNEWDYVLIPDCRFPNEIERLKQSGIETYTLRIERENFKSDLTEEQLNHISETALDNFKFDCVIKNTSLNEFYDHIKWYADYIEKCEV